MPELSQLLDQTRNDLWLILPQVMLLLFGCSILLMDFWLEAHQKWFNAITAMFGVGMSGFALLRQYRYLSQTGPGGGGYTGFGGSVLVDPFFVFFGFLFLAATALVILLSVRYMDIENEHHGEYYALMLLSAAGMLAMTTANDLIVVFLALELLSIPLYVLSGFAKREGVAVEAALKFFLVGSVSSAVMAYGLSFVYGITRRAPAPASPRRAPKSVEVRP